MMLWTNLLVVHLLANSTSSIFRMMSTWLVRAHRLIYICTLLCTYNLQWFLSKPWILHELVTKLPGTGSSYFYRGSRIKDPFILSWIPDPDPFIFIEDPGSRIRILLFYRGSRIPDPKPLILSWIRILLFYCGSGIPLFLSRIHRGSDIKPP
jgi:hypothetical protein